MNNNVLKLMPLRHLLVLLTIGLLAACGSSPMKPSVKTPPPAAPANTPKPPSAPPSAETPATPTAPTPEEKPSAGGYYLDDGPDENAPANLDNIPGAALKSELPDPRANRPYSALGMQYTPMKTYAPYKKQGIASWYGKRFHGKKTSTGEIYDMYAMSAAHTVLPIPSYAKVTNPANGRSVIVRVNDRGPFKRERLIDLSYAAAYQLRLIKQGYGLVEVETIDTRPEALQKMAANKPVQTTPNADNAPTNHANVTTATDASTTQYYVQAGAFKNEANGEVLQKKIQGLSLDENVGVANVYNNGLYRVKLGPYATKNAAETSAATIRRQLNIAARVIN